MHEHKKVKVKLFQKANKNNLAKNEQGILDEVIFGQGLGGNKKATI